ncbi:hypothetical protein KR074_002385 [Drosophila pseudoananassae]|nr:hypothetical protein KR074_002385 [Drosophila pseudoananassae]
MDSSKDSLYWKMMQHCPGNEFCEEWEDFYEPIQGLTVGSLSGSNEIGCGFKDYRPMNSGSEKEGDMEDPEMGVYDCSILYKVFAEDMEEPEMGVYDCSILYKIFVEDMEEPEMGVYDCSILYKILVEDTEEPEMGVYDCSILYKNNEDPE